MSAGSFELSKYEANDGGVYPIRVQPETLALTLGGTANAAPAGDVDQPILAKVSRANGAYGVRPRKVTIRFTAAPPDGYSENQTFSLPVMQPTLWDGATTGTVAEYLGVAAIVVSRSAESIR